MKWRGGIVEALKQVPTDVPMVALLTARMPRKDAESLPARTMTTASSLEEGARMAVEIAKNRG